MTHPTPLAEKIAAIEKALRIYSKAQWALDMADALAERAKDVAAMEEALGLCRDLAVYAEWADIVSLRGQLERVHGMANAALAAAAKGQGTVRT
jgi:hypothetical protein